MIESINLRNVATYDDSEHKVDNLRKINFFFGNNGVGKTTLSRFIRNPDRTIYPSCELKWVNNQPLETKVYNRDFVTENFSEDKELRGIFTLGKQEANTKKLIEESRNRIQELKEKINSNKITLGEEDDDTPTGKFKDLSELESNTIKEVWVEKKRTDKKEIQKALKGVLNDKAQFFNKVIESKKAGLTSKKTFEELETKAQQIFSKTKQKYNPIEEIDFSKLRLIFKDQILSKHIIGKSDIDIAELINNLKNSDWVQEGRKFLKISNSKCPFCQNDLPDGFEAKLETYFDKTYEQDKNSFINLKNDFNTVINVIKDQLIVLKTCDCPYIQESEIDGLFSQMDSYLLLANSLFEKKENNLSIEIELPDFSTIEEKISSYIKNANAKIKENNELVDNIDTEKSNLINEVWGIIVFELNSVLKNYETKKKKLETEIKNLQSEIISAENEEKVETKILQDLEKGQTSVIPTKDEINNLLAGFGFTSFKLDIGADEFSYKLVRNDGSPVDNKLSEGEQSFISFLYFYQLLKGNLTGSTTKKDYIVVIDDPVTSMDNDVLYIVSTLIRKLMNENIKDNKYVKQIFVLTHNLFFFKEVGFDKFISNKSFYSVRKVHNKSVIEYQGKENPIKSTYELLWEQLEGAKANRDIFSIQNTMRRILEYYFVLNGQVKDLHGLPEKYSDCKRDICKALISWINTGSHSVFDDLYYPPTSESDVERYSEVFEDIFKQMNQYEHYKMMMKIEDNKGAN